MWASSTSQIAASSTLGCDVQAFTWLDPRPPQPMTATRTRSLGLPKMDLEAARAAVLIRKWRRFIGDLVEKDITSVAMRQLALRRDFRAPGYAGRVRM